MNTNDKKIVILGNATIIASVIDDIPGYVLRAVLNDGIPKGGYEDKLKNIKIDGNTNDVNRLLEDENTYLFVSIMTMKNKKGIWDKLIGLNIPKDKWINIIHPTAIVPWKYCSIGTGIFMAPQAQFSPGVTIGDNCIFFGKAFVGHDATLDRYVVVANNASIGYNVHVERGCHIGSNCTIRENVTIGEFSVIGMGSVVLNDVEPYSIVAGVPSKKINV
jgi:acetyltransferase EpsM